MIMTEKSIPKIYTWITSSQKRIFTGDRPEASLESISAMRNEPVSFCLGYRSDYVKRCDEKTPDLPIAFQVESEGIDVSVYKVGYVPVTAEECEDGESGVCPEILIRKKTNPEIKAGDDHLAFYEEGEKHILNVSCLKAGSVYFTVNEEGKPLPAGDHEIKIKVISLTDGKEVTSHILKLHIVDACLPENDLIYTNWFHYDALVDYFGVKLYSEEYFDLLERYIRNAALHGMTALLTPAFTPALDTPVGMKRMNVQLVKVKVADGGYEFDMTLLERFMKLAKDSGIKWIEHCHLFSQWGATSAINIYADVDGEEKQIFGWDDAADGERYAEFLRAYIPEFLKAAERQGFGNNILLHISDEPKEHQAGAYARALASVKELIGDRVMGDALSDYHFYEKGLVQLPIVDTCRANDFDGRCDNFMLYYTGGRPHSGLSNRLVGSSPMKTRMIGAQLFRYNAKGFLHWGYNYYYGRMTHGVFNPAIDPYGYRNMAGASYLVYPGFDRTCQPSIREKQMGDAVSDYRALRLLESLVGRAETLKICAHALGVDSADVFELPSDPLAIVKMREAVNKAIEENI